MSEPSHHLFIGGTGRAGTTMLVEYLTELGMDTHVTRDPNSSRDKNAEAGHEDMLLLGTPESMPYVVKDPWLFQYVDQLLADKRIVIDGLILPVRNLMEAATSRVVVEMQSIHQQHSWVGEFEASWKSFGKVPGGLVYSLDVLDQARLLAVGFHEVLERFAREDIPVYFLHLDNIMRDRAYLYNKLRPVLPAGVTLEQAIAAHDKIVDKGKIRASQPAREESQAVQTQHDANDRAALMREIRRLNDELRTLRKRKGRRGRLSGALGGAGSALHDGGRFLAGPLRAMLRRLRSHQPSN